MFEFGRFIDFEGRRDSDHPQHTSRCGRIDIADKKQLIDGPLPGVRLRHNRGRQRQAWSGVRLQRLSSSETGNS